jgi:hypothetical protein
LSLLIIVGTLLGTTVLSVISSRRAAARRAVETGRTFPAVKK